VTKSTAASSAASEAPVAKPEPKKKSSIFKSERATTSAPTASVSAPAGPSFGAFTGQIVERDEKSLRTAAAAVAPPVVTPVPAPRVSRFKASLQQQRSISQDIYSSAGGDEDD
jgi:hypothetical protein